MPDIAWTKAERILNRLKVLQTLPQNLLLVTETKPVFSKFELRQTFVPLPLTRSANSQSLTGIEYAPRFSTTLKEFEACKEYFSIDGTPVSNRGTGENRCFDPGLSTCHHLVFHPDSANEIRNALQLVREWAYRHSNPILNLLGDEFQKPTKINEGFWFDVVAKVAEVDDASMIQIKEPHAMISTHVAMSRGAWECPEIRLQVEKSHGLLIPEPEHWFTETETGFVFSNSLSALEYLLDRHTDGSAKRTPMRSLVPRPSGKRPQRLTQSQNDRLWWKWEESIFNYVDGANKGVQTCWDKHKGWLVESGKVVGRAEFAEIHKRQRYHHDKQKKSVTGKIQ